MMDFGLDFDDELFEEARSKAETKEKSYEPKQCEKEWFLTSTKAEDGIEEQNIKKLQADLCYISGKHDHALEIYQDIQESPYFCCSTLKRELAESVVRSLLKLKEFQKAETLTDILLDGQEEDASLWLLLAKVYSHTGDIKGEIKALQKCVALHTYNHDLWFSLAQAYIKAHKLTMKNWLEFSDDFRRCKHPSDLSDVEELGNSKTREDTQYINNIHSDRCNRGAYSKTDFPEVAAIESKEPYVQNSKDVLEKGCGTTYGLKYPEHGDTIEEDSLNKSRIAGRGKQLEFTILIPVDPNTAEAGHPKIHSSLGTCENKNEEFKGCLSEGLDENCGQHPGQNRHSSACTVSGSQSCQEACVCGLSGLLVASELIESRRDRNTDEYQVIGFFCLIRTRFLLQRAVSASASFVKEKVTAVLNEVDEQLRDYFLCQCGELKRKISQQLAPDDSEGLGQTQENMQGTVSPLNDPEAWFTLATIIHQQVIFQENGSVTSLKFQRNMSVCNVVIEK